MSEDNINHPSHYTSHPSGVECIEITRHMDFLLGNALKYIWRADLKDDALEDLQKAQKYLEWAIDKRVEEKAKKAFADSFTRPGPDTPHFDKSLLSHYLEEANTLVQEAARYTKTPEFEGPTSSEAFNQVGDLKVVDGPDGPTPGRWNLFQERTATGDEPIRWQVAPDDSIWHENGKSWGDGLKTFLEKAFVFLASSDEPFWKVNHREFPGFLHSLEGEAMMEYAQAYLDDGYYVTFLYGESDEIWELPPNGGPVFWGRPNEFAYKSCIAGLEGFDPANNRLVRVDRESELAKLLR